MLNNYFIENIEFFITKATCSEVLQYLKPITHMCVRNIFPLLKSVPIYKLQKADDYSEAFTIRFFVFALGKHLANKRYLLAETYISYILKMHLQQDNEIQVLIDNIDSLCRIFDLFEDLLLHCMDIEVADVQSIALMIMKISATSRLLLQTEMQQIEMQQIEMQQTRCPDFDRLEIANIFFIAFIINNKFDLFVALHDELEKIGYKCETKKSIAEYYRETIITHVSLTTIDAKTLRFFHCLFDRFGFNMRNSSIFRVEGDGFIDILTWLTIFNAPEFESEMFESINEFFKIPGIVEFLRDRIHSNTQFRVAIARRLMMCITSLDHDDAFNCFSIFLENGLMNPNEVVECGLVSMGGVRRIYLQERM